MQRIRKWLPLVLAGAVWSTIAAAAAAPAKQASVISKPYRPTTLVDPLHRPSAAVGGGEAPIDGELQVDPAEEDMSNALPRAGDDDAAGTGATERAPIASEDTGKGAAQCAELAKWFDNLQRQLVQQVLRQRVAEKDHLMMQKWLVDNINDLHRELKQTESDFEHYVQVTKRLLLAGGAEQRLIKQQLARATRLPLSIPIYDPRAGI